MIAKIKIEDIAMVEQLDEEEQRAMRGAGFAAWLKNRSADSAEPEDWAEEEADERESTPSGTDSTKAEPPGKS